MLIQKPSQQTLWGWNHYFHTHFTDEKSKEERGKCFYGFGVFLGKKQNFYPSSWTPGSVHSNKFCTITCYSKTNQMLCYLPFRLAAAEITSTLVPRLICFLCVFFLNWSLLENLVMNKEIKYWECIRKIKTALLAILSSPPDININKCVLLGLHLILLKIFLLKYN